jgi:hypothetical protein
MLAFDAIKPRSRLRGLDAAGIAEVVQVSRFGADALNLVFRVNGRVVELSVPSGGAAEPSPAPAPLPIGGEGEEKTGKALRPWIEVALPHPDVLANRFKEADFRRSGRCRGRHRSG